MHFTNIIYIAFLRLIHAVCGTVPFSFDPIWAVYSIPSLSSILQEKNDKYELL